MNPIDSHWFTTPFFSPRDGDWPSGIPGAHLVGHLRLSARLQQPLRGVHVTKEDLSSALRLGNSWGSYEKGEKKPVKTLEIIRRKEVVDEF